LRAVDWSGPVPNYSTIALGAIDLSHAAHELAGVGIEEEGNMVACTAGIIDEESNAVPTVSRGNSSAGPHGTIVCIEVVDPEGPR
jgi:hypothetical protein